MIYSLLFLLSFQALAKDVNLTSEHFLLKKEGLEAELSCQPIQKNSSICKLTTFSVQRLSRVPGGVCPFKKVSQERVFHVNVDPTGTAAQGSAANEKLSFQWSQQKITSLNFSGNEFTQAGQVDPCEEYMKQLLTNAASKLPLPANKKSAEPAFDRHDPTKQQLGVGDSLAPNPKDDPNLGNK